MFVLATFVPVKAFLSLKTTARPSEYVVAVPETLVAQFAVWVSQVPLVTPVQEMLAGLAVAAMPSASQPRDQRGVHRCSRRGVFANRAMSVIRDKQVRSGHGNAIRISQPRDQGGVHRSSRRGVFANRAAVVIRDKQVRSGHGNAIRINSTPRPARRSPFLPTWCIRQSCRCRNSRQTGPIRTRQCQPDYSTPRPERRSRLLPTWCIRQSCRCLIRDKQVRSGHGNASRIIQPRDQRGVHDCTRRGVFANRAGGVIRDKQVRSRHGNARRH